MLVDLPPEVLMLIFGHLVRDTGIHRSVRLRPVCRSFNEYILDAIFALPTFENVDEDSADQLAWDIKMSKSLVAKLIRTKLRTHQEDRALNREILQTVNFITSSLPDAEKDVCTNALFHLAADNLPLYEIIKGLSKGSSSPDIPAAVIENALAAALFLDQSSHVQALLNLGAKAVSRTKWFGDALYIAAGNATPATFFSILGTVMATGDKVKKRLAASRLVVALEHAATQGRADIFCADLWPFIKDTYEHCLVHKVFEPAITGAALACHDNVIFAIFNLLGSHDLEFLNASDDTYWIEVLRLAASNGSESTVRLVLDNTAIVKAEGSLTYPLEDACRSGSTSIVKLLMANQTGHNVKSYAGSVYWAARRAECETLALIFGSLERSGASYLGDALCGASVRGPSGMSAVLQLTAEWLPVDPDLEVDGKSFAETVDFIFEAAASSGDLDVFGTLRHVRASSPATPEDDIFKQLLTEEQQQIDRTCREGSFPAVHYVVAQFGAENTGAEPYAAGGFSASIRNQRPGILQYLCEKFPKNKYLIPETASDVQSTAILQILLENGWSANTPTPGWRPPLLGRMVYSEELTRWFLDHDSDPNTISDWDITPLSAAVVKGSLSSIFLMLRQGGDLRKGQSLHYAIGRASLDQLAIVEMLLSFGIPLEDRMFENHPVSWVEHRLLGSGTPLHGAAELGNSDAVAYLLSRGASAGIPDSRGRTTVDIARAKGHHEIVEMIETVSIPT